MKDVYDECPKFENDLIILEQTKLEDAEELLLCYSDKKSVKFFNSDNCHGDNFYYTTLERMKEAIKFWEDSYKWKYFIRWTVVLKETNEKIGTIEMFNRGKTKNFGIHGVLRIDLRSKYERKEIIESILDIANLEFYNAFNVDFIATKTIEEANERIKALRYKGYKKIEDNDFDMSNYYGRLKNDEIKLEI